MASGGGRRGPPRDGGYRRRNRAVWDRTSAAYDARHARTLRAAGGMAWGLWRRPESELRLLAPLRGSRVLELGCGAARWSAALERRGARSVGIDLSAAQLRRGRALLARRRARVDLVRGTAESLPFADGQFDQVFCDWGAMTFADPSHTVPEVARVLRPGGRFVFTAANPFRYLAFDRSRDRQSTRLRRAYFGFDRITFDGLTEFTRTYGEWVALFRSAGLEVERLLETRPPAGRRSGYLSRADERWARSWPLESVWQLRRSATPGRPGARRARRNARSSSRQPG